MQFNLRKISEDQYEAIIEIAGTKITEPFWFFTEKEQYKELVDFAIEILNECSRYGNAESDAYIQDCTEQFQHLNGIC